MLELNPISFDWMDNPTEKESADKFQNKLLELLPTRDDWTLYSIFDAAYDALGDSAAGRYSDLSLCEDCHKLFNCDCSHNSDPDHSFCGTLCEIDYYEDGPGVVADYNGDLEFEEPSVLCENPACGLRGDWVDGHCPQCEKDVWGSDEL